MEGFFGKPFPADHDDNDGGEVLLGGCEGGSSQNENSMLGWDWRASTQYGGQSANLADWLGRITRDPKQPRITTWTSGRGGEICRACDNLDVKNAIHQVQSAFSERYALWNKRARVREIRAAAEEKKCNRCRVLLQALHYLQLQDAEDEEVRLKFLPASVAIFTEEPPRYLEVFPSDDQPSPSSKRTCGFPATTNNGKRKRFADVSDPACFEDIIMAINDCILHHRQCRPSANPARPNRLVVVPEEDGQPVRIIKAPTDAEYAALSHCWGKEPLKRLLREDCTGDDGDGDVTFEWHEMPPSFQDACTVARRLFLQYVWIDSLCIVQDDGDDWEREAAKMGSIYESAYVTISATDAAASAHGFLFPRFMTEEGFTALDGDDDDHLVRFTARRYNLDGSHGRFPHYGDTPDHPWLLRANDMDTKHMNPLQQRGWCFQERLMSKRVLHFKRYEVVLECNVGFRCECSGMKTMSGRSVKSLVSLLMQESLSSNEILRAERLRDLIYSETGKMSQDTAAERVAHNTDARLIQTWEMLVEVYTRTSFTHQDDVLPALGSLARIFQAVRPQWTYLCGLWLDQLQRSLMWVPQSTRGFDGGVAVRTKPVRADAAALGNVAPSFSWASLSGRIRYVSGELAGQTEFEVVSAMATPVGTDPYGDVASGHMILRGRAVAFRFYMAEELGEDGDPNQVTITIDDNDWDTPGCSQSMQHVKLCTDLSGARWKFSSTSKIESGIETMQRIKGFDSSNEYSDFFDDGTRIEMEMNEEDAVGQPVTRAWKRIKHPLIAFRLTSGCRHGLRGIGAVVLLLKKSSSSPLTYRRVGLRTLKDQIFNNSPEMEFRIE